MATKNLYINNNNKIDEVQFTMNGTTTSLSAIYANDVLVWEKGIVFPDWYVPYTGYLLDDSTNVYNKFLASCLTKDENEETNLLNTFAVIPIARMGGSFMRSNRLPAYNFFIMGDLEINNDYGELTTNLPQYTSSFYYNRPEHQLYFSSIDEMNYILDSTGYADAGPMELLLNSDYGQPIPSSSGNTINDYVNTIAQRLYNLHYNYNNGSWVAGEEKIAIPVYDPEIIDSTDFGSSGGFIYDALNPKEILYLSKFWRSLYDEDIVITTGGSIQITNGEYHVKNATTALNLLDEGIISAYDYIIVQFKNNDTPPLLINSTPITFNMYKNGFERARAKRSPLIAPFKKLIGANTWSHYESYISDTNVGWDNNPMPVDIGINDINNQPCLIIRLKATSKKTDAEAKQCTTENLRYALQNLYPFTEEITYNRRNGQLVSINITDVGLSDTISGYYDISSISPTGVSASLYTVNMEASMYPPVPTYNINFYSDRSSMDDSNTELTECMANEAIDNSYYRQYVAPLDDSMITMLFFNLNKSATIDANSTYREGNRVLLQNLNFRKAIAYALQRDKYNEQLVGSDLKYAALTDKLYPHYDSKPLSADKYHNATAANSAWAAAKKELADNNIRTTGIKLTLYTPERNKNLATQIQTAINAQFTDIKISFIQTTLPDQCDLYLSDVPMITRFQGESCFDRTSAISEQYRLLKYLGIYE